MNKFIVVMTEALETEQKKKMKERIFERRMNEEK